MGGLILTNNSKYYIITKILICGHLNIKNLPRGKDKAKIYGFSIE